MSKFMGTPGPWEAVNGYDIFSELGADSGDGYKAPENDGWLIAPAELGSVNNDDGEIVEIGHGVARANARLIAAAPCLLEALRNLELGANTVDGCYKRNPRRFAVALRDLREYAEAARAAIAKATGGDHE